MKRVLLLTLSTLACGKAPAPVLDAGAEQISPDTAPPRSDVPVSLAVDFSVENCPSFDPKALTCSGTVPLLVRFVPLATTTVTQYFWDFGDGTPSDSETTPSHVYTSPGVYSVSVVATGATGGVVSKGHAGFMIALANAIGQPCDADVQCNQGLFCLCPASAPCNPGPAHGLCASSCQSGICNDTEQVCAKLRTATPPAGMASAWQAYLCLPACAVDEDCPAGLRCRTLPPGPAGSAWIHGCFANVPGDVGDPCMDSMGNLRDDLCASGLCADLGAKGMCSASCDVASCPPGSDCTVFGDGRKLCLRPCTNFLCDQDPLLNCVQPTPGALGYELASSTTPNVASSYCAPQPCTLGDSSTDLCLPTGTCVYQDGGSHCVRRSN